MAGSYYYHSVVAQLGIDDPQVLHSVRSNLYHLGTRDIRYVKRADLLLKVLRDETTPDILIVDSSLGITPICEIVTRIRRGLLSDDPFLPVIVLTNTPRPEIVSAFVNAGVDDLLPIPWPEGHLDARLNNLVLNRKPFVITSDYIGPDRRGKKRQEEEKASVRPITVPNALKAKVIDRADPEKLRQVIAQARTTLNGDRIQRLAELVVSLVRELNDLYEAGEGRSALSGACLKKLSTATEEILSRSAGTPYAAHRPTCRTLDRTTRLILKTFEEGGEPELVLLQSLGQRVGEEFRSLLPQEQEAPVERDDVTVIMPPPLIR